jgi:hypothetical protein
VRVWSDSRTSDRARAATSQAKRMTRNENSPDLCQNALMIDASEGFVLHPEPVWRDRADFVVHAELPEADRPKRFEQLWARQLAEREFELCCIPFFIYDVALGDVVRTSPSGSANTWSVRWSGHRAGSCSATIGSSRAASSMILEQR